MQNDGGGNPADHAPDFRAVAFGLQTPSGLMALGYVRFDGDGVSGFPTPLGTGHGFLGWSDVITTTMAFGVRDLFVRGQIKLPALGRTVNLATEAHVFHDADGAIELGRERDISASLPVGGHWSVELKAAHFEADHPVLADADKGRVTVECRY